MRPVERVDITAAGYASPPSRLHGSADFQGKLVEMPLPPVLIDPPFVHQTQQIAVGAHVVESVIMHTHVADVRGHRADGSLASVLEHLRITVGVILDNRRTELKPLCPLGPAASRVLSLYRKNRRPIGRVPRRADSIDFLAGNGPKTVYFRGYIMGR